MRHYMCSCVFIYGDVECAQQPCPHSPTGDLGEIAGVNGQNSKEMCQGDKPGTGKLYTDVALPTPVGAWSMAEREIERERERD